MRMTTYGTLLTFGLLFVIGNGSTKTFLRPEDGDVVVGDIIYTKEQMAALKGDHSDYGDYNAVRDTFKHWSDGILYYDLTYMPSHHRNKIRHSLETLSKKTDRCLQFREVSKGPRIQVVQGHGCQSWIGKAATDTNPQGLSLDNGCLSEGTIQHEFLHAAGIGHTQNRFDRDKYVTILYNNIASVPGKKIERNFDKFSDWAYSYHGLPYDFDSVMHYGGDFFGKRIGWGRKMTTIQTRDPANQGRIGSDTLSVGDIKLIKKMYRCPDSSPGVSCGEHRANSCSSCPEGKGAPWCNGDCKWINGQCMDKRSASSVSCGQHSANSCGDCPQGHGEAYCNGECIWRWNQCVNKN